MRRRSLERSRPVAPTALLRSTPRAVRLNRQGLVVLLSVLGCVLGTIQAGRGLYQEARASEVRVERVAREVLAMRGVVERIERRNGGDNPRRTIVYRLVVDGAAITGATTLRRDDRTPYDIGGVISIRYLASDPSTNWLEGYPPRPRAMWPAVLVPAGGAVAILVLILVMRRQADLLANGRFAEARVVSVDKRKNQHGAYWRVHYTWTLLSGAVRSGHYDRAGKVAPTLGETMPILYDRDVPERHARYPVALLRLDV